MLALGGEVCLQCSIVFVVVVGAMEVSSCFNNYIILGRKPM